MNSNKITLTLVTPEHHVLTKDVDMIVVPGETGEFGVLPKHTTMISNVKPGLLTLYNEGEKQHLFITNGFANVTEENCTILAETSEFVTDMNPVEIEHHLQQIVEEIAIARSESEREELEKNRSLLSLKLNLMKKLNAH